MNGDSIEFDLSRRNEALARENRILKDRLNEIEELRKRDENEMNRMTETFEMMKSDRKRLKCEKLELLNQTRDLYKVIESKENEIRDVLKAYELRTKETSFAVKKIIDGKTELEREKSRLEIQIMDLVEEKNQLNLILESKNVMISKLQKQIYELKSSNSPRNSLGKESDCGYSSSSTKSRDTLSSSLIDSALTTTPAAPIAPAAASVVVVQHHNLVESISTPTKKSACSLLKSTSTNKSAPPNDSFRKEAANKPVVVSSTASTSVPTKPRPILLNNDDLLGEDLMSRALMGDSDEFIDLDDDDDQENEIIRRKPALHTQSATHNNSGTPNKHTPNSTSLLCTSKLIAHHQVQAECAADQQQQQKQQQSPSSLTSSSSSGVVSSSSASIKTDEPAAATTTLVGITNSTSVETTPTNKPADKNEKEIDDEDIDDDDDEHVNIPIKPVAMTTPTVSTTTRSSRLLNTLIRMSTIGNGGHLLHQQHQQHHNRSSALIEPTSTTLSSSKILMSSVTRSNQLTPTHVIMRNNSTTNLSSKSSYYVNELAAAANVVTCSTSTAAVAATAAAAASAVSSSAGLVDSASTNNLTRVVASSSASTAHGNKLYRSTFFNSSEHHNSTATKFDTLFAASSHRHSMLPSSLKNCMFQPNKQLLKRGDSSINTSTMSTHLDNATPHDGADGAGGAGIREETETSRSSAASTSSSASLTTTTTSPSETGANSGSSPDGGYSNNNSKLSSSSSPSEWSAHQVRTWLQQSVGMLPFQVNHAMKLITCGRVLLALTDVELERVFALNNAMHRRKLRLAIDELKLAPEKSKYPKLNEINTDWITSTWLKEIGLVQYSSVFKLNLVDGRVLASLQKKDLEKHFGMQKRHHQTSLLIGIEFLRKHDFDILKIKSMRDASTHCISINQFGDVSLWTSVDFVDWLKLVNLQAFASGLDQSGLHGALVTGADNAVFNTDFLYAALGVGADEVKFHNMRKILDDEIKLLKKSKTSVKSQESSLVRPIASFKSDKRIFTFRGSLGRALGKKIKRDISSPLIDDDTYKRIEFGHKLIDMKEKVNVANCSAV